MTRITVYKIGGSLLENPSSMDYMARYLYERVDDQRGSIIVVSAMKGATDRIIEAMKGNVGSLRIVEETYSEAARETGETRVIRRVEEELALLRSRISRLKNCSSVLKHLILSSGERMSRIIFVSFLKKYTDRAAGIEAHRLLVARNDSTSPILDSTFSSPGLSRVRHLLEKGGLIVIEGFVASSLNNGIITLGRGGSDYTATFIGASLHASRVFLLTRTPGVLTGDPHIIAHAKTVPRIGLREACVASKLGVKRFHQRTFEVFSHIRYVPTVIMSPFEEKYTFVADHESPASRFKILGYGKNKLVLVGNVENRERRLTNILEKVFLMDIKLEELYLPKEEPYVRMVLRGDASKLKHLALLLHDNFTLGGCS